VGFEADEESEGGVKVLADGHSADARARDHKVRRRILRKLLQSIPLVPPGKHEWIAKWKGFPVQFHTQGCKRVYSLVAPAEATRFGSEAAAVQLCCNYGLDLNDCQITETQKEPND